MEDHLVYIFLGLFALGVFHCEGRLQVSTKDLSVLVEGSNTFQLSLTNTESSLAVSLNIDHTDLIHVDPYQFDLHPNDSITVKVFGVNPGHAVVSCNTTPFVTGADEIFVRVTIQQSEVIFHISAVVGWIYFAAWSVSFYPQIYINWKRKSVVGLNFDFLSLNILGFFLYSLFNCGLYWIPAIENEYFRRFPKGLNPVQLNDIVFSLHAMFATSITIFQCFIFERGSQSVSRVAYIIFGIFTLFLTISLILSGVDVITWLDFLYYCSYVKLSITLIKYVPQAYMNYRRKSTVGWSIGNIFLDFTGGMLSMLQMILNAHNYNDWESIFGDPTKFGLGLFSVVFDLFFMTQHYILYRDQPGYIVISGDNIPTANEEPPEPVLS